MSGGRVALAVLGPITRDLSALVTRLAFSAAGGKGANPAFAAS
jgi:hypothetical protein